MDRKKWKMRRGQPGPADLCREGGGQGGQIAVERRGHREGGAGEKRYMHGSKEPLLLISTSTARWHGCQPEWQQTERLPGSEKSWKSHNSNSFQVVVARRVESHEAVLFLPLLAGAALQGRRMVLLLSAGRRGRVAAPCRHAKQGSQKQGGSGRIFAAAAAAAVAGWLLFGCLCRRETARRLCCH